VKGKFEVAFDHVGVRPERTPVRWPASRRIEPIRIMY
jgi:hypothetical protein